MGGHAHPVPEAGGGIGRSLVVGHELPGRALVLGLRELRRGEQPVHLRLGVLLDGAGRGAGADGLQDRAVAAQVEAVQLALPGAEAAVHREHPGDVAHVVADVGREVHEQQLAVLHLPLARVVVRVPGVARARDQRVIRLALRAVAVVDELGHRVQLVLPDAGHGGAHGLLDAQACQARGPLDEGDLARALDEPQLVQRRREVLDAEAREAPGQQLHEPALARGPVVPGIVGGVGDGPQGQVAAGGESLGRPFGREDGLDRAAARRPREVLGQHLGGEDVLQPAEAPDEVHVFGGQHLALALLPGLVAVRQVDGGAAPVAI